MTESVVGRVAELGTVGAVLKYPGSETLAQITASTTTEDYEIPAARSLRAVMDDLPPEYDTNTIKILLERDGTLENPVTAEFISEALQLAPLPINLPEAIQSLKTFRASRSVSQSINRMSMEVVQANGDPRELGAVVDSSIQEMTQSLVGIGQSNWTSAGDVAEQLLNSDDAPVEYIETGLEELDMELNGGNGLGVGQMVTIAARPSFGKSTLALDMLRHAAESGQACLLFSLEMKKTEQVARILGAMSRVSHNAITKWEMLTDSERERVSAAAERLKHIPLYIDDRSELTMQDIRSTYSRLNAEEKAKNGTGIKLVGVDYLQLLTSDLKFDSRQNEVAHHSRQMKIFANDSETCVIAVAQLNRGKSKDSDVEFDPKVSDLRESGQIENDSDIVLLIAKEEDGSEDPRARGAMKVRIGKNRNGSTKDIPVTLIPHYPTFEAREPSDEEELEDW